MPTTMQQLEAEALKLDLHARAHLAGRLLLSLDEPSPSEIERLWLDEAERRLEEYHSGKVVGIPADEVFKRALAELS